MIKYGHKKVANELLCQPAANIPKTSNRVDCGGCVARVAVLGHQFRTCAQVCEGHQRAGRSRPFGRDQARHSAAPAAATAQEFAAPAAFLCAPRGHSGGCAYTGECHCRCVQHAATCGTAISLASADECTSSTSSTSSASSAAGGHSRCDQCCEL